jgi:exopolysaccharide production protein ExoQ
MPNTPMFSSESGRASSPAPKIDKCTVVPILICFYATVLAPLIYFVDPPAKTLRGIMEPRWENRIFWPTMAVICIALVVQYRSRIGRINWPPHIICLLACLAFAGTSVLWSFNSELSFIRFVQQAVILISIVLPAMLAARTADMMHGLFLCFALGSILNVLFVPNNPQSLVESLMGYPGYFTGKNYLGQFAAVAFLLSLYELFYRGVRRTFGIIIAVVAIVLLYMSNSKTAFGLAFTAPCLAGLIMITGRSMRISPATLLVSITVCYAVLASITGFNKTHISYWLYGDWTFTGRTVIWDFANYEIARRPLFGWGYQSFWLGASLADAPGWVKNMASGHSGYVDTMLDMGYIGLALLISFIFATLYAIGRVADHERARAWILLSLALYIILYNFLESLWMRGIEFLWLVFVIVAAEAGRYWQRSPSTSAARRSRAPSRAVQLPRQTR